MNSREKFILWLAKGLQPSRQLALIRALLKEWMPFHHLRRNPEKKKEKKD